MVRKQTFQRRHIPDLPRVLQYPSLITQLRPHLDLLQSSINPLTIYLLIVDLYSTE